MKDSKQTVAAFDFDGTLTYHDTLRPFIKYSIGSLKTFWNVLLVIPYLLGFVLGLKTRQQVKEAFLTFSFKGKSMKEIKEIGEQFATEEIPSLLKPEALECLRRHQEQNHRCILVSATLDVYLEPWSKAMGFDDLICTQLEESQGKATGKIKGINCWGEEKVVRLKELLGAKKGPVYAYGDSLGDKELLCYADFSFYRSFPRKNVNS